MECIYCHDSTSVVNSRHQKKVNHVWRRRVCQSCGALFSSLEAADLERSLSVRYSTGHLEPFMRDKLFISIFKACGHRKDAIEAATALTETVMSKLLHKNRQALIDVSDIATTACQVLKRFDTAAFVQYKAYHQS